MHARLTQFTRRHGRRLPEPPPRQVLDIYTAIDEHSIDVKKVGECKDPARISSAQATEDDLIRSVLTRIVKGKHRGGGREKNLQKGR